MPVEEPPIVLGRARLVALVGIGEKRRECFVEGDGFGRLLFPRPSVCTARIRLSPKPARRDTAGYFPIYVRVRSLPCTKQKLLVPAALTRRHSPRWVSSKIAADPCPRRLRCSDKIVGECDLHFGSLLARLGGVLPRYPYETRRSNKSL